MSLPRLRPAPDHDPRPDAYSPDAIARALTKVRPLFESWAGNRNCLPAIERRLPEAFSVTSGDAYEVARFLERENVVAPDADLVRAIDALKTELPGAMRSITGEWCLRTGIRFPAYEKDVVEFFIPSIGRQGTGEVVVVDKVLASGRVQRPATGEIHMVLAEDVIANVTRKLRASEASA